MKRFLGLVLMFLLLVPFSLAQLEVSVEPLRDSILLEDEASFNVTVKNLDSQETSIDVFSQDTDWILRRSPRITSLDGNQKKSFTLYLNPTSAVTTGPKGIDIFFKSLNDDEVISKVFYVYLGSDSLPFFDYSPSVKVNAKINDINQVDPREKVNVKVELKNRNPLKFDELKIILSSNFFSTQKTIELGPFEETTEYFEFSVDNSLKPQTDYVYVQLIRGNDTFEDESFTYEIVPFSPFFKKEVNTKEFFMGESNNVTFTNVGNINKEEVFKVPVNLFSKYFYSFEPVGEYVVEGNDRYYVWDINLDSREKYNIYYVKDFRLLFYLILGAILGVIFYFLFRSPIVLKKEVFKVQKREGGIYELKVILYVKNRSRRVVNNLQLFDRVPHLAEVIRESYLGSIKPDRILKDKNKGSLIKWLIPNVESLEERIITYKIRSKFTILGKLSLPRARSKFVTKSSKIRVTYSNKFEVEA